MLAQFGSQIEYTAHDISSTTDPLTVGRTVFADGTRQTASCSSELPDKDLCSARTSDRRISKLMSCKISWHRQILLSTRDLISKSVPQCFGLRSSFAGRRAAWFADQHGLPDSGCSGRVSRVSASMRTATRGCTLSAQNSTPAVFSGSFRERDEFVEPGFDGRVEPVFGDKAVEQAVAVMPP